MSTFGFPRIAPIAGQLDLEGGEIAAPGRAKAATRITEKTWQGQVVELAELYQWLVYHTYDSRRSNPGWPDLVLCRPPEFLVVELKTEKGRVSPAQTRWLDALNDSGIETHVWRPSDFDAVHDRLRRAA